MQRRTPEGEIDWHIVLAKVTDTTPPTIVADPKTKKFEVRYNQGRYFVREDLDVLRSLRQRKTADKQWPTLHLAAEEYQQKGSAGESPWLGGWESKSWVVITVGSSPDAIDCLVRLASLEMDRKGYRFEETASGLNRCFHGDNWLLDDGEFLVTLRTLEETVKLMAYRKKLIGSPAPEIDGKTWLNTEMALPWNDLRGKVVLLDFWGQWCNPA